MSLEVIMKWSGLSSEQKSEFVKLTILNATYANSAKSGDTIYLTTKDFIDALDKSAKSYDHAPKNLSWTAHISGSLGELIRDGLLENQGSSARPLYGITESGIKFLQQQRSTDVQTDDRIVEPTGNLASKIEDILAREARPLAERIAAGLRAEGPQR